MQSVIKPGILMSDLCEELENLNRRSMLEILNLRAHLIAYDSNVAICVCNAETLKTFRQPDDLWLHA